MNTPKKKKSASTVITTQDVIKSVGETLLEELKEKDNDGMEVFEIYTHMLHSKIHFRVQDFPTCLVKGYDALINKVKDSPQRHKEHEEKR